MASNRALKVRVQALQKEELARKVRVLHAEVSVLKDRIEDLRLEVFGLQSANAANGRTIELLKIRAKEFEKQRDIVYRDFQKLIKGLGLDREQPPPPPKNSSFRAHARGVSFPGFFFILRPS